MKKEKTKTNRVEQSRPVTKKCHHKTVAMVGYAFMIVGTVVMGLALIPLAWSIPMTIYTKHKLERQEHIGVGFKVCALLFVSLVAGILLLCDSEKE